MHLLEPVRLGPRTSPNRILFGPHVTNLGDEGRRLTDRHVAYYARRASGGCGVIVVEGASVEPDDWPYERAPLAERCGDGWRRVADSCHIHGTLVIASLDHSGGQGSSAYSQAALLAPSRVPEVNTREVPKWMEADEIARTVDGFRAAAALAVEAECDGVEVNAGQHSLVRQFLSGLTNHRGDEWGTDRACFARAVVRAVREATGPDRVVGMRLSCDELAPWAGITPDQAPDLARDLAACGADYVAVVRGGIFSAEKTRPDVHEMPGFNIDTCRAVRAAVSSDVAVVLQGSVVDPGQAEWVLGGGVCDVVEMTRAQIADPDLAAKLVGGDVGRIRPCILCNQTCQVRDARNPIVSCVGEPSSGHETEDPDWYVRAPHRREVLVVGAGPAGLEAARVAALRGHHVRVVERDHVPGGTAAIAGPGRPLVDWLVAEARVVGAELELGSDGERAVAQSEPGTVVVQCTGSIPGDRPFAVRPGAVVVDVRALRAGDVRLPERGPVAVFDPIGGPIGVALAEELGERALLVTQDHIAGNELSRTGDLAPANVRLAQRGVHVERRAILREVRSGEVDLEDRFTGRRRTVAAAAVVDCGFRLPDAPMPGAHLRAGDCVAPRTIHEAILEGRRAALAIDQV